MSVSRLRQDQLHTEGSAIVDTLVPADHDANAVDLADTVNYLASQFADMLGETNWYDAPDASLATIWGKTFLDEKMALREVLLLTDITVPNGQNYKILVVGDSETPAAKVKAIGAGVVKGLVTANHGGTFGTHSLTMVSGDNAINPKNLLQVVDGDTHDEILSAGQRVWGLLQNESGATDGSAFTDTTPERPQVSFVRINSTGDAFEAVPVADIEDKVINLSYVERQDLDTWVEQDFLRRTAWVDLGSASASVTLDNAIDNQGTTPATQATNIYWRIADATELDFETSDGARNLVKIAPASGGDELEFNVDTLDVNVGSSGVVDIDNGVTVDSGGTSINLGVTAGQIDASALKVAATGGAAEIEAHSGSLILDAAGQTLQADATIFDLDSIDDSHLIMSATDAAAKTLLVAARNAGAGAGNLELEADDDILFETVRETTPLPLDDSTAGAISALFGQSFSSVSAAIAYAGTVGGADLTMKLSVLGSSYSQGDNVPAATLDLTAYTLSMVSNAATVFLFLNGRLLRGAAATGTGDVYPGTTPASGDVKFDFPKGVKSGDVIISIGLKA